MNQLSIFRNILLASIVVALASCSQKSVDLKTLVEECRNEFRIPQEVIEGVTIYNIGHDDNNLVFEYLIKDTLTAEMFKNSDYMKLNVSYTLKDQRYTAFTNLLKDNGYGLKYRATDQHGNLINELVVSSDELGKDFDKSVVVNATALAENSACPIDYQNGSSLQKVIVENDSTITYLIECEPSYAEIDFPALEQGMKRQMVNTMANNESKQTRHDIGIYYKYVYKTGDTIYHAITISPDDWIAY